MHCPGRLRDLPGDLLRPERPLGDLLVHVCLLFRRRQPVLRRLGPLLGGTRLFLGSTHIRRHRLVGLVGVPILGTPQTVVDGPGSSATKRPERHAS